MVLLANLLPLRAEPTLGLVEASPFASRESSVGVALGGSPGVHAMQVDILFDEAAYEVSRADPADQPGLTEVDARVLEPGKLRVVVYRAPAAGLGEGLLFSVPLRARTGVVDPFPVVLTNYLLVGEDGQPLTTTLSPNIGLTAFRDGADVNGRLGLELTVATDPAINRVEYYIGGVLLGEGSGPQFALRWFPSASGPYEVYAVGYDGTGKHVTTRTAAVDVSHIGTYLGPVKGTYAGLIRGNLTEWDTAGYVTMTTATNGVFTFRAVMGGGSAAGRGTFDEDGIATISIPRRGRTPLQLQLTHSSDPDVDEVVGKLTDGTFDGPAVSGETFLSEFTVDRLTWNPKTNPAALFAGSYTVLLPPSSSFGGEDTPPGHGYGTASVGSNGKIKVAGRLGDGEALTQSTFLSKDGGWPLYKALYRNQGMVIGKVTLRDSPGISDGDGPAAWLRLPNPTAPKYPAGFDADPNILVSRYTPPAHYTLPLSLQHWGGNALFTLDDSSLVAPLERAVSVDGSPKIFIPLQGGGRIPR